MDLEELVAALLSIRGQCSAASQSSIEVRLHPDVMLNLTDSVAAIRSVELVDDAGGRKHVSVMLSNAVVR